MIKETADAIREFSERIKKTIYSHICTSGNGFLIPVIAKEIDDLVKEMTEVKDGQSH